MQVILLERVEKLGIIGDVVSVKTGFARNYLLPTKRALRATEANKAVFDAQRKDIEANNLKEKAEAEAIAKKMKGLSVSLIRQAGESGQLYGSVNSRDIAIVTTDVGYKITRAQVILNTPIKTIGLHDVRVKLHPEVVILVSINVARSEDEAHMQKSKGGAVSQDDIFENQELADQAASDKEEVELAETEHDEEKKIRTEDFAKQKAQAALEREAESEGISVEELTDAEGE
jgi:large subunit ribosomal protein L9